MLLTLGRRCALVVALLAAGLALAARQAPAPILILISFDGWRADYTERAQAPHLNALAARGIRSQALIPSFPTLTFPNHYTIVTGLVPDHHGIVGNTMLDAAISPDRFTMSSTTAKDARWWGGEPIWTTAIKQGQKSASMFWPGSEAVHPTYWKPFDDRLPNADRVAQVLTWLRLPEAERPSFITLYFSDVDSAGHNGGPDSKQALDAAARVDESLGVLVKGVQELKLLERTTIVVISDHGMSETSPGRLIYLDDYVAPGDVNVIESGASLAVNPVGDMTVDALYGKLAGKHPALAVYRKAQMPPALQFGTHPRVAEIIGVPASGWYVTTRAGAGRRASSIGGAHGYDPRIPDMRALFVAAGPTLRQGVTVPELQNIHLYEFMCKILQLRPARNDGDPALTADYFVR